jgi:predicted LPLAT superfamily acyltransferase/GT2 family glycosyltransferase
MNPCVVIPVYNHGEALVGTLENLAGYNLPTIVVDDGSDVETKAIIVDLVTDSDIELVSLPQNLGKGGAVMAGLRSASKRGFTHVLQIDADGQHDLGDVETLLGEAEKQPEALISGKPQFDDTVPASRLYGRWITRFWVWIETLSLDIPDAMCGFRVYPLETIKLIDSKKLGSRMDFDIEVAVRLYWRGVPFVAVPTHVIYPEGGTSHFHVLQDNWRISRMHTILFFGMLLRLPVLLFRKLGMHKDHWSTLEERGAITGMKILFSAYKLFGRSVFRVMLFPVMVYFFLTSSTSRRASREYLDRVEATLKKTTGKPVRRLSSIRHFVQFGESILDKTAQWAGVRSKVKVCYVHPERYQDIIGSDRGGVFIGSHLGNLEALRAFGGTEQSITVNALVFTRQSKKFMKFLEEANPRAVENLIQVDTLGPESVISMQAMVEAREWIALVADRTSVSRTGRSVSCNFLGDPAEFPEGPFILAALLNCPVYFIFCLKNNGRYEVHLEKLTDALVLNRATRQEELQRVIKLFASRMEQHCLTFPYQWYNFFDFWQEPHTD